MGRRHQLLIGISMLGVVATASPALAQQSPQPAGGLEDIIVTAQRVKQNIQEVPIAVTSLSSEELAQQQVVTTADLPRLVPNFFTGNNVGIGSGNVYFLRGLGQTESLSTYDPQVGTYLDDIYIGRESGGNFGLFDADQVQVLRGPQGTLFGRNSTGGAIVITSTKPHDTFGGYVDLSYGSYNGVVGKAAVDIPIDPQILTRTAIYGNRSDGYVNDVATGKKLNGRDDYGFRESVTIKPAAIDNLTWNGTADYIDSTYSSVQNAPIGGKRVSYSGFGDTAALPAFGGGAILDAFSTLLKEPVSKLQNGENLVTWGVSSNFAIDFAAGTLNVISGLRGQRQLAATDFPFPGLSGPVVPFDENELGNFGLGLNALDRQYSQEVKWTGKFGDKLTYTAGLFYLYESASTSFIESLVFPPGSFGAPAVLGPIGFNATNPPVSFYNTTNSKAAYLQGDYHATDKLTVTLGGRITDEHKSYNSAGLYTTGMVSGAGNPTELKTDQFTPRASVQYQFTPEVMAFGSATRGFQGGGWNSLTGTPALVAAFAPETLWTYEGGVRTETVDHRLRVNADFFYNDIRNYQLQSVGPGAGVNLVSANAAGLVDYGFEMDATYRPIDELTLSATLGIQRGYYVNPSAATLSQQAACKSGMVADCGQGIVNPAGNLAEPENLPPLTFTLGGTYDWRFSGFTLTPAAAVQFMAAQHVDTQGIAAGRSAPHYVLDLGVTYQRDSAPWSFTAECKNCTQTDYLTSWLFASYYNTPGTWDVKINYKF